MRVHFNADEGWLIAAISLFDIIQLHAVLGAVIADRAMPGLQAERKRRWDKAEEISRQDCSIPQDFREQG